MTIVFLITAGGCWDRREPESLAPVMGFGFNYDRKSEKYEAHVSIAKPTACSVGGGSSGGGGSGGGREDGSFVTSAKGESLFEALRLIEPLVSRELFWGHSEVVIIAEDLAREGIEAVLDFYAREHQSRQSNLILITGDKPQEVLEIKLPLEEVTGVGIRRQIQTIQTTHSVIPKTDIRLALIDLNRPGREMFIPRISLKEKQPEESSQGGGSEGGGLKQEVEIAGGAAFCGYRMAGWVELPATQGWIYVTGLPSRSTEMIPCPDSGPDRKIAVEINRLTSKMEVKMSAGKPKFKVKISVEGRMEEKDCRDRFTLPYVDKLNLLLAQAVKEKAVTAIKRGQELRSDIFGFGNAFYRKYPREWKSFESDWENHFSRLEVDIDVKAHIRRPGLVADPPPF